MIDNLDKVFFENTDELRNWLQENHSQKESIWLVKWKKSADKSYISYDEIVDELMCFGWVDSIPRKLNEEKTMILISPRNPKSNWSGLNKRRVSKLIKQNRMEAGGIKSVEISKKNGTWDFLNDVEKLIIPKDLKSALVKNEKAGYYFERFPDSSKRGILEWIKNAKQAKTREKRILDTVNKASINLKANHPKGRDAGPKDDK